MRRTEQPRRPMGLSFSSSCPCSFAGSARGANPTSFVPTISLSVAATRPTCASARIGPEAASGNDMMREEYAVVAARAQVESDNVGNAGCCLYSGDSGTLRVPSQHDLRCATQARQASRACRTGANGLKNGAHVEPANGRYLGDSVRNGSRGRLLSNCYTTAALALSSVSLSPVAQHLPLLRKSHPVTLRHRQVRHRDRRRPAFRVAAKGFPRPEAQRHRDSADDSVPITAGSARKSVTARAS